MWYIRKNIDCRGTEMKTVRNALEIIEILVVGHENQRLTTIAEKSGLNKTSTYKILQALSDYGYVVKSKESNRYSLGEKLLNMPRYILEKSDFRQIALPTMERLFQESHQTINLFMLIGRKGYYSEIITSDSHKHVNTVGDSEHLYSTALGKAVLSALPREKVDAILREDPPMSLGINTITDPKHLYDELELTKRRGFAIDDEESYTGARCVAAPIFNREEVIGSISISGNASHVSISQLFEFSAFITKAAAEISAKLV